MRFDSEVHSKVREVVHNEAEVFLALGSCAHLLILMIVVRQRDDGSDLVKHQEEEAAEHEAGAAMEGDVFYLCSGRNPSPKRNENEMRKYSA